MPTNLENLQRTADSTTSRAWYTVPVRRLFFKIMAPFLVHLTDRTSTVEERQLGLLGAHAQTLPRIDRLEEQGASDRALTAALSEQGALDRAVIAGLGDQFAHLRGGVESQSQTFAALSEQVAQIGGAYDKVRQQLLLLDGLRKEQMAVGTRLGSLEDTLGRLDDHVTGLADRITQGARDTARAFPGVATLPRDTTLAIAGTSLVLHDGTYGRFLLRQPDLISDHVTRGGFWDAHLKPIIERTGRPDRCAIDAGAYLGFHSTYMSRYFGTVYSFEPQLEMYRMTCTNLLLNNCRNVVAKNGALYDVNAHMQIARRELQEIPVPGELAQPAYDVIGNAAALVFELVSEPNEHSVPCTTIDTLGLTTLGLLKIDTQGSDLHVLKGARETIARCRPTIVAEFERELAMAHHDTYDDYLAFFQEMDYEVSVLEDRSSGKQIDLLGVPR